jgi:hypothetical protein
MKRDQVGPPLACRSDPAALELPPADPPLPLAVGNEVDEAWGRRDLAEASSRESLSTALCRQRERARRGRLCKIAVGDLPIDTRRLVRMIHDKATLEEIRKELHDRDVYLATTPPGRSTPYTFLHLACGMDPNPHFLRQLMSEWTQHLNECFSERLRALEKRLKALDPLDNAAMREWVDQEWKRLARLRELRAEAIWHDAITRTDHLGRTPLHYCCCRGSKASVEALLTIGRGQFHRELFPNAATLELDDNTGLVLRSLNKNNNNNKPRSNALTGEPRTTGPIPLEWVFRR